MSTTYFKVQIKARCVCCNATRWIKPGDVPSGDVPVCHVCFSPMVAIETKAIQTKAQS